MKKSISWVLLLLLITGCKSPKPLVSTSSETKIVEQVQKDVVSTRNETETETSSRTESQTVVKDETTTIFRTDYDTDKPVDPTTGKHPVKSETKTETIRNSKQDTLIEEQKNRNKLLESNIADKSNINTNQDKKEVTTEESLKDPYRYRYIFYIIISLVITMFSIYLLIRRSRFLK